MTDRQEAEARLAAAREELAAAEAAHREVVPCDHRTIRVTYPDKFSCGDCEVELPDPRGCMHLRIDNDTECCVACGEKMLRPVVKVVKVLSAPNKAACTIPGCDGGPGCENPDGVYVPDLTQQVEVPVRKDITYICERCRFDGSMFVSGEPPIWECGRNHRGDSVPIRGEERV
ncbi:DUF7459 domain-containing protein [Nocardia aurea]|jgi:hypothetical protein|uniref:DUF7459 domain-containing protein n=1 Tax=Nocardia aurea TaxID=2144174 RepID=UPI0033A072FD